MKHIPQPPEAPTALSQAFAALAGELRALAGIAKTPGPTAILQALILLALARIVLTLHAMVLDWEQGRLPALQPPATPRPTTARRPHAPSPRARTRSSARPYSPQAAPPRLPRIGTPQHAKLSAPASPYFSKPAFPPAPTHAHFITIQKLETTHCHETLFRRASHRNHPYSGTRMSISPAPHSIGAFGSPLTSRNRPAIHGAEVIPQ